jgi:hypothetical protein
LRDFVLQRPYILHGQASSHFTLDTQYDLSRFLSYMEEGDTSILYRATSAYLKRFKWSGSAALSLLERFCSQHPQILSGAVTGDMSGWSNTLNCELSQILDTIEREDKRLGEHEVYRKASAFSDAYYRFRTQMLSDEESSGVSDDPPVLQVQAEERVKHGPPAVPAVQPVPVSSASVVSNVLATAPKGLSAEEVRPTTQVALARVEDFPVFGASGSTSREFSYNRLLDVVRYHWSREFTFDSQRDLLFSLQCMTPGDPSVLVRFSRACYNRYRRADADVFGLLEQFCQHHPCVLSCQKYCDELSWKSSVRRELKGLLDNIIGSGFRKRPLYVQAEKFLSSVPLLLPSS